MKLLQVLTIVFLSFHTISAACPFTRPCLHGGIFDQNSCLCSCFPSYTGNYCESNANCSAQSSNCAKYTTNMCTTNALVTNFCPALCNASICKCGIDQCLNGGTFNNNTCSCNCPAPYVGSVCGQCNVDDPIQCGTTFTVGNCVTTQVKILCPKMCGYVNCDPLNTTTTITSTPANCQPVTCQNGGLFNNQRCACDCLPSFSGANCQVLTCGPDKPVCTSFTVSSCSQSLVYNYCPTLCGRCSNNGTNSLCGAPLQCKNGGTFNPVSCKCVCPFSTLTGTLCDVCTPSNAQGCNLIPVSQCSQQNVNQLCPHLCGLCGNTSTNLSSQCTPLQCKNGATFDPVACKCVCPFPSLTGALCDLCLADSAGCSSIPATQCSQQTVPQLCPNLCGLCNASSSVSTPTNTSTSIIPAMTISQCTPLQCQNGGQFDPIGCKCNCQFPSLSGKLCEVCIMDSAGCSSIPAFQCTQQSVSQLCPILCGLCKTTSG